MTGTGIPLLVYLHRSGCHCCSNTLQRLTNKELLFRKNHYFKYWGTVLIQFTGFCTVYHLSFCFLLRVTCTRTCTEFYYFPEMWSFFHTKFLWLISFIKTFAVPVQYAFIYIWILQGRRRSKNSIFRRKHKTANMNKSFHFD